MDGMGTMAKQAHTRAWGRLLLALLVFWSISSAQASAPVLDWAALSAPYRLANETYSTSPAQLDDASWLFLLYVNGTPISLVSAQAGVDGRWNAQVLENENELEPAVRAFHKAQGNGEMAGLELDGAQAELDAYNASRRQERDCLEALGLLAHPCFDYDSCFKACFASSEFCQPLAQANGKSFIYRIWDYENKSRLLDEALESQKAVYELMRSQPSSTLVHSYNSSLFSIWAASAGMLDQPLSGALCQKPFYDSGAQGRIQAHLSKAMRLLAPMEDGQLEAKVYAERVAQRRKMVQTAGGNLFNVPAWTTVTSAGGLALGAVVLVLMVILAKRAWSRKEKK